MSKFYNMSAARAALGGEWSVAVRADELDRQAA